MKRQAWVDRGRTVALRDDKIWYRTDGAGPTLLFLHGYPTSSHDWAPVIARLAARYRCVSFDFLGFGASSKPRRAYTYALQHEVLATVVAAAQVTRAVVVAHDYAVTLGQDFLAGTPRPPFELDGVIFLNGGLDPAQHRARPLQRALASRAGALLVPLITRRGALRALRAILVRADRLPDDDVWDSITSNGGLRVMPRLLHYIAERRGRRDALRAALAASFVHRRAFIWGMDDPVSGRHMLEAIRPLVAGAPIRELDGVGHYPQLEAPDEVVTFIDETVAAWLR